MKRENSCNRLRQAGPRLRVGVSLLLLGFVAEGSAQSPRSMNAAELHLALKRLSVVGSALYVAAHPDDENTALLSYLAKGRMVRTAYLSVTRGEGGQNLIGPEQGELLGLIRTQELLAARRIDGAEQYFTRAIDFGYSKTSEETIRFWGRESTLSDIVWIIRNLRPDVIITRFSPTLGGHGNHTASAILAEEAFHAAGDPKRFPRQLCHVQPWRPKRILFNVSRFLTQQIDTANAVQLDLGEYNPLLGRSYSEIAGLSRSMHKSQGFGAAQSRGAQINYFLHTAGEQAHRDIFDGIDLSWRRIEGGERVARLVEQAYSEFHPERPSAILPILFDAYREMVRLQENPDVMQKRKELVEVIKACAGLWVDALASEPSATPGDSVRVTLQLINRSDVSVRVESLRFPFAARDSAFARNLEHNQMVQVASTIRLPVETGVTQPYWLVEQATVGAYRVSQQHDVGMPENLPVLTVAVALRIGTEVLYLNVPVRYRWVDPIEGELYRAFDIIPPLALNLSESVHVFRRGQEKSIAVVARAGRNGVSGDVRMVVPQGWRAEPSSVEVRLTRKGDEATMVFRLTPEQGASSVAFRVEAVVAGQAMNRGIVTVDYRHIPPQTMFPPAEGKLLLLDVESRATRVGYIMGSGDEIPPALRQLGYSVDLLTDEDIANGDLGRFGAIIAGVRAYNTRPQLRVHRKKLLEYVEKGGTYIVQYVTQQRLESEDLGPYPFNVSRERVSVEDAPVVFLEPNHPLLNVPNRITPADFDGWVQERGLYFADTWDEQYATVIASHDPGEPLRAGGLLYARYGKGHYIYTGYAFFRQLPAGVPGAYRLFVNLISVGK